MDRSALDASLTCDCTGRYAHSCSRDGRGHGCTRALAEMSSYLTEQHSYWPARFVNGCPMGCQARGCLQPDLPERWAPVQPYRSC